MLNVVIILTQHDFISKHPFMIPVHKAFFLGNVVLFIATNTVSRDERGYIVLHSNSILRLSDNASFRSMGDSGVILMTDTGQLYSCNETAEAFMRQLGNEEPVSAIAANIAKEFEVEQQVLYADLSELIEYLVSERVLIDTSDIK